MAPIENEDTKDEEGVSATDYISATVALDSIIKCHLYRKDGWFSELAPEQGPYPVNWPAAANAISADADAMELDLGRFLQLEAALDAAPDPRAAKSIREFSSAWAEAHWEIVESSLRKTALAYFTNVKYPFKREFGAFVERWPRLRENPSLIAAAVEALQECVGGLDASVAQLRVLRGSQAAAAKVLAAVMAANDRLKEQDELASLLAEWAGDTAWGQLQHRLWHVGEGTHHAQNILADMPKSLVEATDLLRDFGLTITKETRIVLNELSAETKASWRRQLKAAIGNDDALKAATTEALLWFGSAHDDRAVLFAVLELHGEELESALLPLRAHPDRRVRLRAGAVLDLSEGETDAANLMLTRPRRPRVTGLGPARTWIGDARIELLIESALDEAARSFGEEVRRTLASGEETHVSILFERLRCAFAAISNHLAALSAETGANERLELKLEHRIVGKHEEGGPGVGSDSFSADICLLFEARDAGRRFANRASLLQAKRLYRRKNPPCIDYYPVKRGQLEDLASQTNSGFLLLVGPQCEGVAMPVIPAQLFLDMIERGEPSSQVAPAAAARLGKGIGAWFVEDVIGLWTGDWSDAIIEKAKGGEGREPYLLVEVVVQRVRRGPDG